MEEFSVYWWDHGGGWHKEFDNRVSPETAAKAMHRLIHGPAAKIGIVHRVIITDGGDLINFEWTKAHGVTFPVRHETQSETA